MTCLLYRSIALGLPDCSYCGLRGETQFAPIPLLIILTGSNCDSSIKVARRLTHVNSRLVAVPPAVVLSPNATETRNGLRWKSRFRGGTDGVSDLGDGEDLDRAPSLGDFVDVVLLMKIFLYSPQHKILPFLASYGTSDLNRKQPCGKKDCVLHPVF